MLHQNVHYLDITDSTNNYAARLIDADKAYHGLTIRTNCQTGGKGQRGHTWTDLPGQSVLMSIVLEPAALIERQFGLSALVAVAVVRVLQTVLPHAAIRIKYPNDIIVNDKKAAGILIENILRGSQWSHAIVGIGINVLQECFPGDLPHATSLLQESGVESFQVDIPRITQMLREAVLYAHAVWPDTDYIVIYNDFLYKIDDMQYLRLGGTLVEVKILGCDASGRLRVEYPDHSHIDLVHGEFEWVWM